jgi:hypothetical protein
MMTILGAMVRNEVWMLILSVTFFMGCGPRQAIVPMKGAHSHNDYHRLWPLTRALNHGFMSVEADVHLKNGRLLVSHERALTLPWRHLERMYLAPLLLMASSNGFASVYRDGPPEFFLYIDIKSGCPDLLDSLRTALVPYRQMLTRWDSAGKHPGAVTILTHPCKRNKIEDTGPERWWAFDGGRGQLTDTTGAEFYPRLSMSLTTITRWRGRGEMTKDDLSILRQTIAAAQSQGREIRFWGATNRKAVWKLLESEGADVINVDRLGRFRRFRMNQED